MQEKNFKKEKGITLVSLVVTIIVLFILAGISITTISEQNGITKKSTEARNSAEIKSEMQMIEVASNSARGENRYGNIDVNTLKRELEISAGKNKVEVSEFSLSTEEDGTVIENESGIENIENIENIDKIGFKITFLNSKREYFIYNEGEDAEIQFVGTSKQNHDYGFIHATPKRGIFVKNSNKKVKIFFRTFLAVSKENVTISYGWSTSNHKEPEYRDVLQNEIDGNDFNKKVLVNCPPDEGIYYLYVKAKVNDGIEVSKQFGQYEIVDEGSVNHSTQYTVTYIKGNNVSKISLNYDTTKTGKVTLPSIIPNKGCKSIGWFDEEGNHVGDERDEITVNKNLLLTAKAEDNSAPTVKLARVDYNTFNWQAFDNGGIKGYQILKDPSVEPKKDDLGWIDTTVNTGTSDISDEGTYYVYAIDKEGNIGKGKINAYLMTRKQGEGTNLTTRVDGQEGYEVTQNIAVLEGTEIYAMTTANNGYTIPILKINSKMMNVNGDTATVNSNTTVESEASKQDESAPIVTITRVDFDTFHWDATDEGTIQGYIISTDYTVPSASDDRWKAFDTEDNRNYDISDAKTYYVYAKDTEGNVGGNSITAHLLTVKEEENSNLTLRVDYSSSSTGVPITGNIPVLNETPIWASATASAAYSPVLKIGDKVKNSSGDTAIITSNTAVVSSAKEHTYNIVFDKNGEASGTMRNMTNIPYNAEIALTVNAFVKAGYSFNGWNTKADGTGTSYANNATVSRLSSVNGDTVTLYAMWKSKGVIYQINHYVHTLGDGSEENKYRDTYYLNSTETKTAPTGSTVTIADLKKTIDGFTYEGDSEESLGVGYIGNLSDAVGNNDEITKPTTGAVTTAEIEQPANNYGETSTTVINLFYRRNKLYVKYSAEYTDGTAELQNNIDNKRFVLDNSIVKWNSSTVPSVDVSWKDDNTKQWVGVYGGTVNAIKDAKTYETADSNGLANYNNSSYINLIRSGYLAVSNTLAWSTGIGGTGALYDMTKGDYITNLFAQQAGYDLSEGDVTITLYVNWVKVNYSTTTSSNVVYYSENFTDAVSHASTSGANTIKANPLNDSVTGFTDSSNSSINIERKNITFDLNNMVVSFNVRIYVKSESVLNVTDNRGQGILYNIAADQSAIIVEDGTIKTTGNKDDADGNTSKKYPRIVSTGLGINLNNPSARMALNGGDIISKGRAAIGIKQCSGGNSLSITNTNVCTACSNKSALWTEEGVNKCNLTIKDSFLSNGATENNSSLGSEDYDGVTLIWRSKGMLKLDGATKVSAGPHASDAIASTYGGNISVLGSSSIFCMNTSLQPRCIVYGGPNGDGDKVYFNSTGYTYTTGKYIVETNSKVNVYISIETGHHFSVRQCGRTAPIYLFEDNGVQKGEGTLSTSTSRTLKCLKVISGLKLAVYEVEYTHGNWYNINGYSSHLAF